MPMFLWLWTERDSDGEPQEGEKNLLPYVVMTGAAFLGSFFPVIVFDVASFLITLAVAATVFLLLGCAVGLLWEVSAWKVGIPGAIPTLLLILALHDWSVPAMLNDRADGIPTFSLPLTCFIFGVAGVRLGSSIAIIRKASKTRH